LKTGFTHDRVYIVDDRRDDTQAETKHVQSETGYIDASKPTADERTTCDGAPTIYRSNSLVVPVAHLIRSREQPLGRQLYRRRRGFAPNQVRALLGDDHGC